jgi:hypothetical protein
MRRQLLLHFGKAADQLARLLKNIACGSMTT